ncbi:DUF4062 domain-containing protein [Salinibacter ruber]|uniref:DUF4062 domain-containing protein n=1 Tax=Salinibacter ruber TaxID=146919 RepID=UPI00216A9190|nr:DUF4062 domain-containing protein [Salinibacter ruber]MCS3757470.1 hypothetical protein [Salinibacter ruber]MCS3956329.1 hypothetical protein [Salinibacter ruber]
MIMKTVFVSSTYRDLVDHRREVWGVLEDFDVDVRGMEQFGARSEEPIETCLNEVEQSDVYVGIIGYRLGSVHDDKGISFTQLEYERARDLDLEILIYIIDEEAEVKAKHIDKGSDLEKLQSFKETLKNRHTIDTFTSSNDIGEKIRRDFRRVTGKSSCDEDESLGEEIENSKESIDKFLLVPKKVSGKEILLDIEFSSKPFPASRGICKAFNLEFGATVGVSVDIRKPNGYNDSDLSHLFIGTNNIDRIWPIEKGSRHLVYSKLQFTEKEIESIKTRFKSETKKYYKDSIMMNQSIFTDSSKYFEKETVHLEAEGNVILLFTKMADFEIEDSTTSEDSE